MGIRRFKTCFISDLHLGSSSSQAHMLYRFLKENDFDILYIVGDFIDIWQLKKAGFLGIKRAQYHINALQRLLKLSKKKTKIYYIYGNHDEFIANFVEKDEIREFGNIHICEKIIYETKKGKKYLVIHGQQFDLVTRCNPWIAKIGDTGYLLLIRLNKIFNFVRRKLGMKYWSLSKFIKVKVKKAIDFINRFEETAAKYAKEQHKADGVICGHIHHPEMKLIGGSQYINTGCWTDMANCTALIETDEGDLELIQWTAEGEINCIMKSKEEFKE